MYVEEVSHGCDVSFDKLDEEDFVVGDGPGGLKGQLESHYNGVRVLLDGLQDGFLRRATWEGWVEDAVDGFIWGRVIVGVAVFE